MKIHTMLLRQFRVTGSKVIGEWNLYQERCLNTSRIVASAVQHKKTKRSSAESDTPAPPTSAPLTASWLPKCAVLTTAVLLPHTKWINGIATNLPHHNCSFLGVNNLSNYGLSNARLYQHSTLQSAGCHHPTCYEHPTSNSCKVNNFNCCPKSLQSRSLSTSPLICGSETEQLGFYGKFAKFLKYKKSTLLKSGYAMYGHISNTMDVLLFFKVLAMEDTFYSWFQLMELHVWMVSVRLTQEGKEGKVVRDALISAMWKDASAKIRALGLRSLTRSKDNDALNAHFQRSLAGYDEGLLGSDRDLAGAVWRSMIRKVDLDSGPSIGDSADVTAVLDTACDPRALEIVVEYIRQQIYALDTIERDDLLLGGHLIFCKLGKLPADATGLDRL